MMHLYSLIIWVLIGLDLGGDDAKKKKTLILMTMARQGRRRKEKVHISSSPPNYNFSINGHGDKSTNIRVNVAGP
ncbi:hypothetical protein HanRHA438_Chr11g0503811 [Helianthus annuus]|nr:hypothetical protein HanRHA438_Chr11g0503811 [Helianthus annuus]